MKPPEKKWPHVNAAPRQPERPSPHAHTSKLPVAQLKSAAPARPHPSAPPVYRPQAKLPVAQRKTAQPTTAKTPPAAPPVYRPQLAPKVLQTKEATRRPVATQAGRDAKLPSSLPASAPPVFRARAASGVRPLVIQRALDKVLDEIPDDPFPELGTKISSALAKKIKSKGLEEKEQAREIEKKAEQAELVRLAEIKKLSRREGWWELLYLNDVTKPAMRIRKNYGTVETKSVHVTVIKANTTVEVDFRNDSAATIVDKVLGTANVRDTVHTTMELNGADHADNPRYFRNGDSPNCSVSQKSELKSLLDGFVADAASLVINKKAQLRP
jgi:hypothetical protein